MTLWSYLKAVILFYVIIVCSKLEELKCEPLRPDEVTTEGRKHFQKYVRPSDTELDQYLKSLYKVVKFCKKYNESINFNVAFGLVLINVNLKNEMKFENNHVDQLTLDRIRDIVNVNDQVLKNFIKEVNTNATHITTLDKLLLTLFINETMWMERIVQFGVIQSPVLRHVPEKLQESYYNMDSLRNGEPNEDLFERCLTSLALNSAILHKADPKCELPDYCHNLLRDGFNVGYALTHRILFLSTARLGRGCIVFSREEDQALVNQLCKYSYAEAENIAKNGFVAIDLLMEHVSFCALSGHVNFLRRSWMNHVLLHQLPVGCFSPDLELVKEHAQKALLTNQREVSDEFCNLHVTAVASIALATTVRYIIASTRTRNEDSYERQLVPTVEVMDLPYH